MSSLLAPPMLVQTSSPPPAPPCSAPTLLFPLHHLPRYPFFFLSTPHVSVSKSGSTLSGHLCKMLPREALGGCCMSQAIGSWSIPGRGHPHFRKAECGKRGWGSGLHSSGWLDSTQHPVTCRGVCFGARMQASEGLPLENRNSCFSSSPHSACSHCAALGPSFIAHDNNKTDKAIAA